MAAHMCIHLYCRSLQREFEIAEIELPKIYVLVGDAGLATMALGETCNLNE